MSGIYGNVIERVSEIKQGILVESSELGFAIFGEKVQRYPFQVYNRIVVHGLWMEVTELIAGACQMVFNYIQTTPSITLAALSTVCSSMDTFVAGRRISYIGGSVAATAVTLSAGISYLPSTLPTMLGVTPLAGVTSVGKIGILSSVADATAGKIKCGILYSAVDPGAYVTALL